MIDNGLSQRDSDRKQNKISRVFKNLENYKIVIKFF